MAIDWSLANGNGFQNALATGLQIGQSIRQTQKDNALADYVTARATPAGGGVPGASGASLVATPEQQAQTLELEKRFQNLARRNPEMALKIRAMEQDEAATRSKLVSGQREAALKAIPTQVSMLRQATPENWQGLRAQAIQLGFGTEQTLPVQLDPAWRDKQLQYLTAFQEQPDLVTTAVKDVMAGLPAEHRNIDSPVFQQAYARSMEKVIPLQQGGTAIGYNPNTGASRLVVAQNPGNQPVGAPVGTSSPEAAPTTKTVGGRTFYNYGGKWYDEPMGGGGSNVTGNFPGPQ